MYKRNGQYYIRGRENNQHRTRASVQNRKTIRLKLATTRTGASNIKTEREGINEKACFQHTAVISLKTCFCILANIHFTYGAITH